jgi:hypothetical protein
VRIEWHQFSHPEYPQCGPQPFVAGLAGVDMLFNCGARSRELLLPQAAPERLRAAA